MTDNEIIKALECCGIDDCRDCPCYTEDLGCDHNLQLLALDLINRQKAGIERLQKYNAKMARKHYQDGRAEAIEDVLLTLEAEANSSDKYIREYDDSDIQKAYNKGLWVACNLVKEMTGEKHGEYTFSPHRTFPKCSGKSLQGRNYSGNRHTFKRREPQTNDFPT